MDPIRFWDFVADSFNPLACLMLAFAGVRRFGWRPRLARFGIASAAGLTSAVANADKVFGPMDADGPDCWPSSHMAFFASAMTSLVFAGPTRPATSFALVILYGWLVAALGYHTPCELAVGAALGAAVAAGCHLTAGKCFPTRDRTRE